MKPNASAPSLKSTVLRSSRWSDATAVINVVAVAMTEPQFNTQGVRDHKTAWGQVSLVTSPIGKHSLVAIFTFPIETMCFGFFDQVLSALAFRMAARLMPAVSCGTLKTHIMGQVGAK